jgi:hypothetical protein
MEFSKANQLFTFLSIFDKEKFWVIKGIIGRYLTFSLNFPLEESKARCEAIKELRDKKLNPCYLDSFFNRKTILTKEPQKKINKHGYEKVKFQCGQISFYISHSRYKYLHEKMTDSQIFEVLFRYHFISGSPFLWSIDEHIYEILVNRFNVTLECFASPLDRRMDRYLSLFEEDKKCGSLGNFFSFPLENERCLVNPPFMSSIFEKMIPFLKNGTFFVFLPMWDDDKFVQEIRKMGCSEVIFKKGEYRFFTLENEIVSKIDVALVCISPEKIDLHVAF